MNEPIPEAVKAAIEIAVLPRFIDVYEPAISRACESYAKRVNEGLLHSRGFHDGIVKQLQQQLAELQVRAEKAEKELVEWKTSQLYELTTLRADVKPLLEFISHLPIGESFLSAHPELK
jgi:hypothetical protein